MIEAAKTKTSNGFQAESAGFHFNLRQRMWETAAWDEDIAYQRSSEGAYCRLQRQTHNHVRPYKGRPCSDRKTIYCSNLVEGRFNWVLDAFDWADEYASEASCWQIATKSLCWLICCTDEALLGVESCQPWLCDFLIQRVDQEGSRG